MRQVLLQMVAGKVFGGQGLVECAGMQVNPLFDDDQPILQKSGWYIEADTKTRCKYL